MKIGILGYGRLGKEVESEARSHSGLETVGIFADKTNNNYPPFIYDTSEIYGFVGEIDTIIICENEGCSDPLSVAKYAEYFNTVDYCRDRDNILEYFKEVDCAAKCGRNSSVISAGWDSGLIALYRMYDDLMCGISSKTSINNEYESHFKDISKTGPATVQNRNTELIKRVNSDIYIMAKIMIAYAKAAYRQRIFGNYGAFTVFDLRLKDMCGICKEKLIEQFL